MNDYIYLLKCPLSGEVKYVGKTANPERRYKQHVKKLDKQMTPKRKWLEMLFAKNLKPIIEVIEKVDGDGRDREQFYVTKYKDTVLNIHNPEKGMKSNKWK